MRVKKTDKKPIIIAAAVAALIIGATAYYFAVNAPKETNLTGLDQINKTQTSEQQSLEPTDQHLNGSDATVEAEKDYPKQYEGSNINSSANLTGVISDKSVTGDMLILRTTINQFLSSGSCELTLANGTKTISRSSGIIQNPSSSSCEGFDIPVTELGSGTWNVEIKVTSGDRTGLLKDSVNI